ncbi:hypothetical protein JCM18899A_31730 [Nocardioides sp. AN3]
MAMHISVDLGSCQGHGLCYFESEELFALRDPDGKSIVQVDPVPERLAPVARRSVDVCPERAIRLLDDAEGSRS